MGSLLISWQGVMEGAGSRRAGMLRGVAAAEGDSRTDHVGWKEGH